MQKIEGVYLDNKSTWKVGLIYAKANEVELNQSSDMGIELDLNYKYQWNDEMTFHLNSGYLFSGDYFAATNKSPKNSYILTLGTLLSF